MHSLHAAALAALLSLIACSCSEEKAADHTQNTPAASTTQTAAQKPTTAPAHDHAHLAPKHGGALVTLGGSLHALEATLGTDGSFTLHFTKGDLSTPVKADQPVLKAQILPLDSPAGTPALFIVELQPTAAEGVYASAPQPALLKTPAFDVRLVEISIAGIPYDGKTFSFPKGDGQAKSCPHCSGH